MEGSNVILVIDDSNTALLLMEYALSEAGYKALVVSSAKEAVEFLRNTTPRMILLDLNMPDISGLDFLKMKKELHLENTPILVVSAYDSPESVKTVKELGAIDLIPKPIRIDALMKIIHAHLK
mgnify:CR=1 FL=1